MRRSVLSFLPVSPDILNSTASSSGSFPREKFGELSRFLESLQVYDLAASLEASNHAFIWRLYLGVRFFAQNGIETENLQKLLEIKNEIA